MEGVCKLPITAARASSARWGRGAANSLVVAVLAVLSGTALAAQFALFGKSVDDGNFIAAGRGCAEEARRTGDDCVLVGGKGAADPRFQAMAIEAALRENRFAAMAVSVTASGHIAKAVETAKIPIITFDSPFDAVDKHLSQAYVGTDNVAFGRDLAALARRLRPRGGSLCLMSAANDSNLAQRVQGIRQALSGNRQIADGQRLSGEGGWTELTRCPWNAGDQSGRALQEVVITLKDLKPDVFISVGQWPVIDPVAYRKAIEPFRDDLINRSPVMIVAIGTVDAEHAALVDEKLVHGYASIDFAQIGRTCYRLMRAAVDGKPVAALNYDPSVLLPGQ